MSDYTPARWDIRQMWIGSRPTGVTEKEAHNNFCTWLAEEMADAWDQSFEATCEARDFYGGLNYTPPNPYRGDYG